MNKPLLLLVILLASGLPAAAQDGKSPYFRRFEIGLEGSYWLEADEDLFGADLSFAVRKSDRLTFAGEFAAHTAGLIGGDDLISYHFGPRFYAKPRGRLQPFLEILAGGARVDHRDFLGTPRPDQSGFSLLAGGGLDLRIKPWFAWRAVRTDYNFLDIDGAPSGVRFSTGLLFRFGH